MADEYTPTTGSVREAYALTADGLDFKAAANRRRAEFDRWLAAHDQEVREAVASEIDAEAARIDALTIAYQDRTAITVAQIKREGVVQAARIAREAPHA